MNEILYADNLVLTSETMENLREKFCKWKEAFESYKGMTFNLGKAKMTVRKSGGKIGKLCDELKWVLLFGGHIECQWWI